MSPKYELKQRLADDTEYYDKDETEKYVDYLDELGRLIRIGNLLFDAEAMLRPFVCDTRLCVSDKGKKRAKSCCVQYTPRLSTSEREKIDEILPQVSERFPWLGKAIKKNKGYYSWDDSYDRMVDKNKKGLCIFMTPDKEELGFYGCTLHAWCLENKVDRFDYQPSACVMFPLFILDVSDEEGTLLVTMHSQEVMTLGEDEDNYEEVRCCEENELATEPIYLSMRNTLEAMFGEEVWKELEKAMRAYQEENAE